MDIDVENYITRETGTLSPVVVLATIALVGTILIGIIYRVALLVI